LWIKIWFPSHCSYFTSVHSGSPVSATVLAALPACFPHASCEPLGRFQSSFYLFSNCSALPKDCALSSFDKPRPLGTTCPVAVSMKACSAARSGRLSKSHRHQHTQRRWQGASWLTSKRVACTKLTAVVPSKGTCYNHNTHLPLGIVLGHFIQHVLINSNQ
jgi:hypothetical protein